MFKMFAQGFNAITILFMALEKAAGALLHLSTWGEEAAGTFADEARAERQKKAAVLTASLNAQAVALANNAAAGTTKASGKKAAANVTDIAA